MLALDLGFPAWWVENSTKTRVGRGFYNTFRLRPGEAVLSQENQKPLSLQHVGDGASGLASLEASSQAAAWLDVVMQSKKNPAV